MSLRIVITSFGSLGDLHPYLALGQALQRRGHRPVLALPVSYGAQVHAAGLEHAHVRPDAQLSDRETVRRIMDPMRGAEFLVRQLLMPAVEQSHEDLSRVVRGADLVVSHPLTFAAPVVAEQLGIRWMSSVLAPLGFFSRLDPPLMAVHPLMATLQLYWPRLYRTLLPTARVATRNWSAPLHALRRRLGLPPGGDPVHEGQFSPWGTLAMFSRVLAEPQGDWPPGTVVTGALSFHDGQDGMSPELQRFLDDGSPPVVFTLGSAAVAADRAPAFYRHALEAVEALGQRAVLLTGPHVGASLEPRLRARVHVTSWAPHGALFARASVVVHQGGAGTMHSALASGRPMCVVPFAHDQGDNAVRAQRLGVARVCFPQQLDARTLGLALDQLLGDARFTLRAAAVARTVRAEHGGDAAVDVLEAVAARLV